MSLINQQCIMQKKPQYKVKSALFNMKWLDRKKVFLSLLFIVPTQPIVTFLWKKMVSHAVGQKSIDDIVEK